jgi:hypothetical protein
MARPSITSKIWAIRGGARRSGVLALATALALALAGCDALTGSMGDWGQVMSMARDGFNRDSSITLEQAAAVPYASLGVRVGDGTQMLVVLATDAGGDRLWTSKSKIAITTRNGRIVSTAGLDRNLSSITFSGGSDPVLGAAQAGPPRQSVRLADYWDINRYSVELHCVTVSRGADSVTVLGKSIAVTRIEESCESEALDWSFTDTFWVGSSGLVWKSIQHVHPDFDPIEIDVLRPPASAP